MRVKGAFTSQLGEGLKEEFKRSYFELDVGAIQPRWFDKFFLLFIKGETSTKSGYTATVKRFRGRLFVTEFRKEDV